MELRGGLRAKDIMWRACAGACWALVCVLPCQCRLKQPALTPEHLRRLRVECWGRTTQLLVQLCLLRRIGRQPMRSSDVASAQAGLDQQRSPLTSGQRGLSYSENCRQSHSTPCHSSPRNKIGTPAKLREPARTPFLLSGPVTRSPWKPPEGVKREEGGEDGDSLLWGNRATGAPLSP